MDSKYKKTFRSAIEELEKNFDEVKDKVGDEFDDAKTKVEKEVKKNPWAAIGIVALVAFILGMLFSPKGRSRD